MTYEFDTPNTVLYDLTGEEYALLLLVTDVFPSNGLAAHTPDKTRAFFKIDTTNVGFCPFGQERKWSFRSGDTHDNSSNSQLDLDIPVRKEGRYDASLLHAIIGTGNADGMIDTLLQSFGLGPQPNSELSYQKLMNMDEETNLVQPPNVY